MSGSMRISQTFARRIQELGERRILEIIEIHGRRNEWQKKRYREKVKPLRDAQKKEKKVEGPMKDGREPLSAKVM